MKVRIRSAYDPEYDPTAYETVIEGPSLTKQSMKKETDINAIVERFQATGLVSHLAQGQPRYLDVSEVGDYRQALEHVQAVGAWFLGLPSELRSEFDNDPAEFLDFVNDPENAGKLRDYGLAEADVETATGGPSTSENPEGNNGNGEAEA